MDPAARNLVYIGHGRIYASIFTGCLAGLLELENLWGFGLYVAVCIVALTAVVRFNKHNQSPDSHVAMQSVFSGLFTFCLFWVLVYNIMLVTTAASQ